MSFLARRVFLAERLSRAAVTYKVFKFGKAFGDASGVDRIVAAGNRSFNTLNLGGIKARFCIYLAKSIGQFERVHVTFGRCRRCGLTFRPDF